MKPTPEQIRAAAEQQADGDFVRLVIAGHDTKSARRAIARQVPAQVEIYQSALTA